MSKTKKNEKIYALTGKILNENSEESYINVKTNRTITNLNKKGFIYDTYVDKNGNTQYICAESQNVYDEFILLNQREREEEKDMKEYDDVFLSKPPPPPPLRGLQKQTATRNFNLEEPDIPYVKKVSKQSPGHVEENSFTDQAVCELNSAGTIIYNKEITDVEDIPQEIIDRVCPFNFNGLTGKAIVTNIVDGDTIEAFVGINFSQISKEKEKGRGKNKAIVHSAISSSLSHTFFTKLSFRFMGVDTAEKNTIQGQFAKLLMDDYFKYLNDVIYFKIEKPDKFGGRYDTNIYSDVAMRNLINDMLIDVRITEIVKIIEKNAIEWDKNILTEDDLSVIALPYGGEAKDNRFKHFPTVETGFITRDKYSDILYKYRICQ